MKKIKKLDYLLIIGVILAPMTSLRFWKVGPGEILVVTWCLFNSYKNSRLKFSGYHFDFWILFLLSILIGTFFGLVIAPLQVLPSQLVTYIYLMLISLGTYIGVQDKTLSEIELIVEKISLYGIVWNLFLFIYSILISPQFLNASLWYGEQSRFSGGGTNPHQLAVFLSAIIFICYRNLLKKSGSKRWINLVLIIIGIYLAYQTASSTLNMALTITAFLALVQFIVSKFIYKDRFLISILLIIIGLIIFVINFNSVFSILRVWIESDPNGLGRIEIFTSINDTLSKSPLFGLGPGTHALQGTAEYHNTYLEVIAMSGIVGLSIYYVYTIVTLKNMMIDTTLVLIILPLLLYGLAGFAMRRLVYWVILMLVISISEKKSNKLHGGT